MRAALKFMGELLLIVVAIPAGLGLIAVFIALALAWMAWPLLVCAAVLKYLLS